MEWINNLCCSCFFNLLNIPFTPTKEQKAFIFQNNFSLKLDNVLCLYIKTNPLSKNCCLNALSALYLMKMKYLITHLYIKLLIDKIINEIVAVSEAYDIKLRKEEIQHMLALAPENYSSMYKDIIHDKDTEGD